MPVLKLIHVDKPDPRSILCEVQITYVKCEESNVRLLIMSTLDFDDFGLNEQWPKLSLVAMDEFGW